MTGEVRIETGYAGRLVRPPEPVETVVLYAHDGLDPRAEQEPALEAASRLALGAKARVLCARHAPHRPAAIEDVHAAYRYARSLGPVVVVGRRLGAGLVTALLLRLRDRGAAMPEGGVLISGLLDLTMQGASLLLNAGGDPAFDAAALRGRLADYAAGTAPDDPLVSPLFGNMHGLPPLRLLVAGNDPLLDDSLAFAARAARSGVTVDLRVRADAAALGRAAVPETAAFIAASAHGRSATGPAVAPSL
ncbi:alpha/beta hydrolase fold domain-containing protein [Actinomadura algeriensis]|uniref:Acetyl esterase/lipase n=1 Tax=Actinomadura algeriensis TaxID=1679523 RepID=A0ABR9K202_9ACTN|nr:alpha/beta hydrolase fold domain-containing protein [Actinomadura algeriensis]MBE1536861.1 acetyl esterase/lipase [Actinomadura algeriensis]